MAASIWSRASAASIRALRGICPRVRPAGLRTASGMGAHLSRSACSRNPRLLQRGPPIEHPISSSEPASIMVVKVYDEGLKSWPE